MNPLPRRRPNRSAVALLLALAPVIASAGCDGPTAEQRIASLEATGLTPSALPDVSRRAGTIVSGHGLHPTRMVTTSTTNPSRVTALSVSFDTDGQSDHRQACVTAIDRRGYYLTAAHAVGNDPMWIECGDVVRPARVVFRGDECFDLAILAVDRPIPDAFRWTDSDRPAVGSTLLEPGPIDAASGQLAMQLFAGRVVDVTDDTGPDGPYRRVTSTLPARRGDSGGPVMTTDGDLVGIFVLFNPLTGRSVCLRPDPAWVRNLVDRDYTWYRATRPTTSPSDRPHGGS